MIRAIYHVTAAAGEAERIAREIALEQTVEVPEALAQSVPAARRLLGTVERVEPLPDEPGRYAVTIGYLDELAAGQLSQLLNLAFGNVSIKEEVKLADLVLPESLLGRFAGPRWGVAGLRERLGVYGRPLLATALKPRGSTDAELAAIAREFALGGGDLVKDDHNLVDRTLDAFGERVVRCHEAVEDANSRTGRRTLYFPNFMPPAEQLEPALELMVRAGVPGILVCPLILGIDRMRWIAEHYPLLVMAHPAFGGGYYQSPRQGIDPALLLGRLMRLAGADISVFPNFGGRFTLSRAACAAIAHGLHEPLGTLRPAWPAPAGGMSFEKLPMMAEQYGEDAIFLIGGGLLSHSADLAASTGLFLDKIRSLYGERLAAPAAAGVSACEWPGAADAAAVAELLRFQPGYCWSDRTPVAYKESQTLPFRDVSRHELIGRTGERTAFELRYFEVAPGGYSSLEQHCHTHTVICIRGEGVLVREGTRQTLRHLDIAYVASMQPHQLRNEGSEPFGFFCIVDRDRDRPIPVTGAMKQGDEHDEV